MNRTDEIYRISNNINKIKDKIEYMTEIINNNQKMDKDNLFVKIQYNAGDILNNKVNEIEKYFKDNNMDFYGESIIKYILENELMKMANTSLNILSKYFLELNIFSEHRLKDSTFFGFRNKKKKAQDLKNIISMNEIMHSYEESVNILNEYDFKEKLIDNIISFIERHGYKWYKDNIGTIESIEDELDNLDLSNLVIELENIIKDKNYIDILPNSNFDLKKKENSKSKKQMNKDDIIVVKSKNKIEVLQKLKIDLINNKNDIDVSHKKIA